MCKQIMLNNPQIDMKFLIENDYEGIFSLFSKELLDKYKMVERKEYFNNFKMESLDYDNSVLESFNIPLTEQEKLNIEKCIKYREFSKIIPVDINENQSNLVVSFKFDDLNQKCLIMIEEVTVDSRNTMYHGEFNVDEIFLDEILESYAQRFISSVEDLAMIKNNNQEKSDIKFLKDDSILLIENIPLELSKHLGQIYYEIMNEINNNEENKFKR